MRYAESRFRNLLNSFSDKQMNQLYEFIQQYPNYYSNEGKEIIEDVYLEKGLILED